MDEVKRSQERREVLQRIAEYERKGWFDRDVEKDPAAPKLLPHQVDYLYEKMLSRLGKRIANFFADRYFLRQMKKQ